MITEQLIEEWTNLRVLIIGDAILDSYIQGTTNRLCREAPVPIIDISESKNVPGGAANTAININSLGADTIFLSVVGDDEDGNCLKNMLLKHEISTEYLITSSSRKTLVKQRITSENQILLRCDQGSIEDIGSEIENQLINHLKNLFILCDAIIISDYDTGIFTLEIIKTLCNLQVNNSRIIVIDSKQLTKYKSINATAIKPNYQQAVQLLKVPTLKGKERIEQILSCGEQLLNLVDTQIAAITLDAEGAIIFERDNVPHIISCNPMPDNQAIGAGDTFVSGLTLALAAGAEVKQSAEIASTAAAIVVNQPGTIACSLLKLRQFFNGNKKIIDSYKVLENLIQEHRTYKQKIVFTNGCFDILHRGHITYLNQAKTLGDILIIGVNSDESIRQLKGKNRPLNCLSDRLAILSALECVDYVISFSESIPNRLIRIICPDVYVKGGDYTPEMLPEVSLVEALGGVVEILPYVSNISTTAIVNRIYQTFINP